MLKYMKYEIKGTYKFILALILTVLVASTGIQLYAYNAMNRFGNSPKTVEPLGSGFLIFIFVLLIFGAFVTAFFYIVGSFRKELYEDRGYLTFSLPLTGNQIVGSKLLIALFWSITLGLSAFLYNYLAGVILFGGRWNEGFKVLFSMFSSNIITSLSLSLSLSSIMTLLLIYFSITLSRVSVRNKKIGGLWFIIFLVLNSLVGFFIMKVVSIFPYYIDLSTFKILNQSEIVNIVGNHTSYFMSPGSNQGLLIDVGGRLVANIGSLLLSLLITTGTFLATGYMIEKKIDL